VSSGQPVQYGIVGVVGEEENDW